ncbi:MAG: transporter [Thermodesulfobacteriota bacterium]
MLPRRILIFVLIMFLMVTVGQSFAAEADSTADERSDPVKVLMKRVQALEEELDYYKKEQDARQALMPTEKEEEKKERTEDVLKASEEEAAQYVLLKQRTIEMRYSLTYQHSSYDKVTASILDIERESYYDFTNSLSLSYGLLPRLSVSANIPFIYKYQKSGDSMEESDLGDVSFGASWQLLKEAEYQPALLVALGYSAPTGRSPYKIDIAQELSTGSGTNSFNLGVNLSKTLDPVIAFGGVSGTYALKVSGLNQKRYGATLEEVIPGWGLSYSLGLGFALSYTTSVTFRFSASHQARSKFTINGRQYEGDESSSASFVIGTGWRISPKTSLNISLGYGLVGIEDYSLYFSVPFDFTI